MNNSDFKPFPCPICKEINNEGIVDLAAGNIEREIMRGDKVVYVKILPPQIKVPVCNQCNQVFTNPFWEGLIQFGLDSVKAVKRKL